MQQRIHAINRLVPVISVALSVNGSTLPRKVASRMIDPLAKVETCFTRSVARLARSNIDLGSASVMGAA